MLGDITATRQGVPVDGDPAFSLGPAASPNHHELALSFTLRRQLLPGAGGLVRRPPLADQHVHHRVRGDALAGVVRRQAARLGRRPRGHRELAGSHRVHRRERFAGAARLQPARRHLRAPAAQRPRLRELRQRVRVRDRRRGSPDRADRHPRARQRAHGEDRPRSHRPPVSGVQHRNPRRAAAGEPGSLQPFRPLPADLRVDVRRPREGDVQAAVVRRSLLPQRSRRRRVRHQRQRPGLGLHTLRAGQRRSAGADRAADLEEPVLEGHGDLRRRGRHPERPRPRRRLPLDLPGDQPVGQT